VHYENPDSYSWFSKLRVLLHKYELPTALDLLICAPRKQLWKRMCNRAVLTYWSERLHKDAADKNSLRYIQLPDLTDRKPHNIWATLQYNTRDIRRATIKAKLATGTYALQVNMSAWSRKTNQNAAICPLCKLEPETRIHFLVNCPALAAVRNPLRRQLIKIATQEVKTDIDDDLMLQLIMDASHQSITPYIELSESQKIQIETLSRQWCYTLHYKRAGLIGYRA
jgi:hypothetical protein